MMAVNQLITNLYTMMIMATRGGEGGMNASIYSRPPKNVYRYICIIDTNV